LNKLLPSEIVNCRPFLLRELRVLRNVRVIVGLGKVGFDTVVRCSIELGWSSFEKRPKFGHGVEYSLREHLTLLGSFHPSQQNTFTKKLTEPMFDRIFRRASTLIEGT